MNSFLKSGKMLCQMDLNLAYVIKKFTHAWKFVCESLKNLFQEIEWKKKQTF